jgi:osmotically-inducible protein OsmY
VREEDITVKAGKELRQHFTYVSRGDAEVLTELKGRLGALPADVTAISISVDKGVVQMIGIVADETVKRRTEQIARSVYGVIAVENFLRTDTSILLRVKAALMADPRTRPAVNLSRIRVTSDKGTVTLEGEIDSLDARTAATQMAARQPGVLTVVNRLKAGAGAESAISQLASLQG